MCVKIYHAKQKLLKIWESLHLNGNATSDHMSLQNITICEM